MQIQEPVRGRDTLSRMPAFSEPAGEPSAPPGTTTNSFPNLGGIDEEYASLARYLELESCTRCPQHGGNQDRKDRALGSSWEDLGHELSIPDASHENRAPRELSALLPQEGSADPGEPKPLSVASPEPTDTITTLETAGGGPRGREAACVLELLEARGQEHGRPRTLLPEPPLINTHLTKFAPRTWSRQKVKAKYLIYVLLMTRRRAFFFRREVLSLHSRHARAPRSETPPCPLFSPVFSPGTFHKKPVKGAQGKT